MPRFLFIQLPVAPLAPMALFNVKCRMLEASYSPLSILHHSRKHPTLNIQHPTAASIASSTAPQAHPKAQGEEEHAEEGEP